VSIWIEYNKKLSLLKEAIAIRDNLFKYQEKMYKEFGYNWFMNSASFNHRKEVNAVVNRIGRLKRKINQINMVLQKRGFTANKYTTPTQKDNI
jgi:hypothetical protein